MDPKCLTYSQEGAVATIPCLSGLTNEASLSTVVAMTLKPKDAEALEEARDAVYEATNHRLLAEQNRTKAIRKAAKNGATLREIAEIVQLSHQAVHKIVGGKS